MEKNLVLIGQPRVRVVREYVISRARGGVAKNINLIASQRYQLAFTRKTRGKGKQRKQKKGKKARKGKKKKRKNERILIADPRNWQKKALGA